MLAEPHPTRGPQIVERGHEVARAVRDLGERDAGPPLRVGLFQGGIAAHVDEPRDREQPVTHRQQLGDLRRIFDDYQLGAGVADDELALLGRALRIDGYRDRPGQDDRNVAQHPLEAGLCEQRDAVAGCDAQRNQAGGDLAREGVGFGPRHRGPGPVLFVPEGGALRGFPHPTLPHGDGGLGFVFPEGGDVGRVGTLAGSRTRAGAGTNIGGRREGGHALNSIKFRPWPRSLCHGAACFCGQWQLRCAWPSTG